MALPKNSKAAAKAAEPESTPTPEAAPVKSAPAKASKAAKEPPAPAPEVSPEVSEPITSALGRKELAAALRAQVNKSGLAISEKVANVVVACYEEIIMTSLANGASVALPGFGNFVVQHKEASVRTNPRKPDETLTIPAKKVPKFRPGSAFKKAVAGDTIDDPSDTDD